MSSPSVAVRGRGRRRSKALGPVQDYAAHVEPDWWRHVFGALYLKTDGDVVDDAAITRREVDALLGIVDLSPTDRVLDLCCGQGRHTLELARRGFVGVEGVDQSRYLLRRARETARSEGLVVRFREGDAREVGSLPGGLDAVLIMGNSFGYFDAAEDDLRVLGGVRSILKPGGKLFLDITDGEWLREAFEPRSWEWIDASMFVCRERWLSPDGRMVSREVITDTGKGVIKDQFYAERLYTRAELAALLAQAGFVDFTVHQEFAGSSERNQDLGMMAHRLFITAIAGEVQAPRQAVPRELVVVLGDPGKPDPVKPDGAFGGDDLDAIGRMKAALERPGRRVRYLSNHDALLDQLKQLAGGSALVVNLCDEGYRNLPFCELHVPALLEALDLRYTGAGPQCLARCFDKGLVRGLARDLGIPVASATLIGQSDPIPAFTTPVIVKPNHGDGSFAIDEKSVAFNAQELAAAVANVRRLAGANALILVEELLTGAELGVGILGNPPGPHQVLPIIQEDYSSLPPGLPQICGYPSKWDPSSPYWNLRSIPAVLPEETARLITDFSVRLFERLECRDYARFDWRLDTNGRPHLLEVNPNPGWCWDGHLAKMAALAGMSYPELLDAVLQAAEERLKVEVRGAA
ncbi:MAG: methyltransferase domain-containing protein [Polyangiaceae bacterium]|nr:methyltransferase domain-containing protein [Polyangiaceae bacterium]